MVGALAFVVYKPHQGKDAELLSLIRMHRGLTVAKGLTTHWPSRYFRTANNIYIEIIEWQSTTSVSQAGQDDMVGHSLWPQFENVCDMLTLRTLPETKETFPLFQRLDVVTPTGLTSIEDGFYQVVVYRVRSNKEHEFMQMIAEQEYALRAADVITANEPIFMRSSNGAIIYVFDWRSLDAAKENGALDLTSPLWSRFEGVADIDSLANLPEAGRTYPTFEHVERATMQDPAIFQVPTHFVSNSEGKIS